MTISDEECEGLVKRITVLEAIVSDLKAAVTRLRLNADESEATAKKSEFKSEAPQTTKSEPNVAFGLLREEE